MHLAESIPYKNHKLYVDNWFTSISFFKHLATRGIWCTGTVQPNRLYGLCFKADKLLLMKGRGTHEEQKTVSDNITLTAVKWIDTRSVCLLSSFLQASPLEKCKRFDKKKKTDVEINQPKCIKLYNKNMGGVDLADQLIALYRIREERREKKFILFSQIKYRENNIITSIFNYNITFKQNYIADRI